MDAQDVIPHLEDLGRKMIDRGFDARVIQPRQDPPFVRVVNRSTGELAEDITCAPWGAEGLSFWWSWKRPICPVRHVSSAAERVAYVLSPETATAK